MTFTKASKLQCRLKMYIYGDSGSGKTVTSLHFPKPVVIDMERGTDHYAGTFDFDLLQTTDAEKVKTAIDQLIRDPGEYRTLVIDPITIFYDQVMSAHLKRKRIKLGNPSETLAPLDYKFIQAELDDFINKLVALDLNVIITAHSAVQYSNEPGEFMKIVGTKPDGYKKFPYMMDVVLELETVGDKRMANVKKDRTNKLPKRFEFTYQEMAKYIGIAELERPAEATVAVEQLNKLNERTYDVVVGTKSCKSAGISGPTIEQIQSAVNKLKMKPENFSAKLRADYGVGDVLDLKEDEGKLLLTDLQTITNQ